MIALVVGLLATLALLPVDAGVASWALAMNERGGLGGDLRRELEAWGQFGAAGSVLVVSLTVWLQDPGRRRRLLDWGAAILMTATVTTAMKMLVGRPRPRLDDPGAWLGPWGAYPMPGADPPGVYHAWEVWAPISSDLWSMPSSHTAHAACAAGVLTALYPRLMPLLFGLSAVVGASRVVFAAHYPSDVAAGGAIGLACGWAAARGYLGVRLVDWAWRAVVDRTARPALPRAVRGEGTGPSVAAVSERWPSG